MKQNPKTIALWSESQGFEWMHLRIGSARDCSPYRFRPHGFVLFRCTRFFWIRFRDSRSEPRGGFDGRLSVHRSYAESGE